MKEGSSQRETSGVFGAQTHRPTAVHYKGGCGVGSKEKNRYDLRWIDHDHSTWWEWWWKQHPWKNLKVKKKTEYNKQWNEKQTVFWPFILFMQRTHPYGSASLPLYILYTLMYCINAILKALQLIGVGPSPDLRAQRKQQGFQVDIYRYEAPWPHMDPVSLNNSAAQVARWKACEDSA